MRRSALAVAAIAFSLPLPAYAQNAGGAQPQAAEPAQLPEVIVEGKKKSPSKKAQTGKSKAAKAVAKKAPAAPTPEPPETPVAAQTLEAFEEGSQTQLTKPYAGGQVARGGRAGLLGNIEYGNSPFSGTSYTSELIKNQQSDSVGDVLLNDPTVRVAQGFGNFQEVYIIRGFPLFSDDLTLNGLYGIVPRQFVAAPLVERVEVLRGVNAFVNGAAPGSSGVGGTVNLVPKRAAFEDLTSVTLGFESDGQATTTIDLGRRFGAAKEWGIRVGATGRLGETAVDDQDRELGAASLGIDYTTRTVRFSADLGYQYNRLDDPRPQVTPTGDTPKPPDADKNYAQPWTYSEDRQLFFVSRGEVDLNEHVTAWAAGGFRFGEEDNSLSNPSADAAGNLSYGRFDNYREDSAYAGDAGVRAEFDTGPVGHRVVVSGSATYLDQKNAFAFSCFGCSVPGGTLDNPIAVPPLPVGAFGNLSNPLTIEETKTSSFAVADTLAFFNERVLLTLGGRYQEINQQSFSAATGLLTSEVDGDAVTPVVGLVVKPTRSISLFANYAEALQRGQVAPLLDGANNPITNGGQVLDPFVSEQYEAGIKYDGGNFGTTLSVFSISQQQGIIEDLTFRASGEQLNRGVELSFYGEPIRGVRLLGGFTVVDARLENTAGGVNEGNYAVGVPKFQSNLGAEWDVPFLAGLTVDGRLIYTGEQYTNATNTFETDDWTRVDLGLRYVTVWDDRPVTLRARVENVANEAYWASVGGFPGANYLVQGAPRTFLTSVTMEF